MYNFIVSSMETILITGGAGFIGSLLADELLKQGNKVICIDNFDDFYDPEIKKKNISQAIAHPNYKLISTDICNSDQFEHLLPEISAIIHLAAKAGVRNSIMNPDGYEKYNTNSITKALDLAVKLNIKKFVFSSSSSIYGNSRHVPFKENMRELNPLNPYAVSKLKSENIGRKYSEKYDISFISLRLFSVYGPRQRPDLLMSKIAQSIYTETPLKIFGKGNIQRDFTHVSDIIDGLMNSLKYNDKKYDVFNLGNGSPVSILKIIELFGELCQKKIRLDHDSAIKGESDITWADNSKAKKLLNFQSKISLSEGINNFLKWYETSNNLKH